jgi:hypothetical protein
MKRVLLALFFIATCSVFASAQQYTYYFPQVATGSYANGSWKTTIFISNSSAPGTTASGVITFTASDGNPYLVQFIDGGGGNVVNGNQIAFQLGAGETRKYESVVTGGLTTGYATVTANAAVLGTAMFTQYDLAGRMVSEAGVPAGIPLGRQAIFVDTTAGYKTGVAIANPNSATLQIRFELLNTAGQIVASSSRDLPAFQHFSVFVHEMYPEVAGMVGRLQFWCTNPMVSVALRFDPTFALFTTMPPIAIAGLIESEVNGIPQLPSVDSYLAVLPRRMMIG